MVRDEELIERLLAKIMTEVMPEVRDSISRTIEQEVTKSLSRALLESEFYKRLNEEMRQGLQDIYKEINAAAKIDNGAHTASEKREADQLFQEAAQQLDKILQTTETATTEIMDIVEKHMDLQAESETLLAGLESNGQTDALDRLRQVNGDLGADLMRIMTTLSFQDLTGQRIKRIIEAIKKVEAIVFDLYLSTGIQLKARAEAPDRAIAELEAEAKQKVSALKGPQTKVQQGDVDDLLSQLGLD
ncbi:MAG: protein phosphatase CheZ [Desulfovibrionaceae bacterium]|jgi:chemotaxis protein CheZ